MPDKDTWVQIPTKHGSVGMRLSDLKRAQTSNGPITRSEEQKEQVVSTVTQTIQAIHDKQIPKLTEPPSHIRLSPNLVSSILKLTRNEYDLYSEKFYQQLPFEKALGHVSPYTNLPIESLDDYFLYGHCYVMKRKTEDAISILEQKYKSSNEKMQSELSIAKTDVKILSRWLLSAIIICVGLFIAILSLPSVFDYNHLMNELSLVKEENRNLQNEITAMEEENKYLSSSVKSAYKTDKTVGYSSGYNSSKKYSYSSSSSSNLNGRENPDPISSGYIGNAKSKKFHLPTCGTLPDQNNQISFSSRDDAINSGYVPCKRCDP